MMKDEIRNVIPIMDNETMAESISIQFSIAVRTLGRIADRLGYRIPQFRCPPPSAKYQRSVRKTGDENLSISIVIRGRPWLAILADIVEGFVIANTQSGQDSEIRNILWDCISTNALQKIDTDSSEAQVMSSAA